MKKWLATFILAVILVTTVNKEAVDSAFGISSKCGVLMEQTTGRVLFEKCARDEMYIASITKIMTAIVAIENADLDDLVEITTEDVHQVGSSLYMVVGDKMTLRDLIYGLMLRSGNDAAWAIARHVGGSVDGFVELMNEKGRYIGMEQTSFQNPSGLDETTFNLSTAYDMALVQRYAMNNPIYREISATSNYKAVSEHGKVFVWRNKHRLVNGRYDHTVSGKTGFTKQAKRTLVTSANNGDLELVAVTLVGASDWDDHIRMFEYGFTNFEKKSAVNIGELRIMEQELLEIVGLNRVFVRDESVVIVRKNGSERVNKNLVLIVDEIEETVGRLEILVSGQVVDIIPVYELLELPTPNWWKRVLGWVVSW